MHLILLLLAAPALAAPPLESSRPAEKPFDLILGTPDSNSVSGLRAAIHAWEAKHAGEEEARRAEMIRTSAARPQDPPPTESEEGVDLLESALWHMRLRAFPEDRVDWDRINAAALERANMPPAAWDGPDGKPARWEFVGPQNVPVPYRIYFGQGPLNGRANALAFDPVDRKTFYLGAAGGGVWKTTDSGANWTPLTDDWPLMNVSSLAVLPRGKGAKHSAVLAGTGDFPYPAIAPAIGLMKSPDGGKSWQRIGPPELASFAISAILVDPDDPRVITISTGRGARQWGQVWRTADGGASWKPVIEVAAAWCGLSAGLLDRSGRRWYWTVGYDAVGWRHVYRSADRGATWQSVHRAGPHMFFNLAGIAASKVDASTAFVVLGGLQKLLVTRNGGETFQEIGGGFPGGYNWAQDWYDLWIAASSAKVRGKIEDVVYVGLIDVVQKVGGNSWRSIGKTYTSGALAHNDQQGVAVDPFDPNRLLTASDGGAYELTFDPDKDTWAFRSLNARLGITQFYRAAYHPTKPDVMLAGTQDNATPACSGDRATWLNVGGGDGAYCGINPKQPQIQFASSQFLFLYRTPNNWKTTELIGPQAGNDRRAFIAPFTLDPGDPTRLYAGTDHLWRWDDGPRKWTPRLGNQKLSLAGVVNAIGVAPSDGKRLYTGSSMGEVWTSGDAGAKWSRIDLGSAPLARRAVTSIAVSPKKPTDVVVTLSGTGAPHVWRCEDAGAAAPVWRDVSGTGAARVPDAPADGLARDPKDPDRRWFLATDIGVFATTDGGKTWKDATGPLGLPGVHVNDLTIVPGTGMLNAATFGRGIWRIPVPR